MMLKKTVIILIIAKEHNKMPISNEIDSLLLQAPLIAVNQFSPFASREGALPKVRAKTLRVLSIAFDAGGLR